MDPNNVWVFIQLVLLRDAHQGLLYTMHVKLKKKPQNTFHVTMGYQSIHENERHEASFKSSSTT